MSFSSAKSATLGILVVFFFSLTSCKKENVAPSALPLQGHCLKDDQSKFPIPEFKKLVFSDEFNGPQPGDKPECFTREPVCTAQLINYSQGTCPKTVDQEKIRNLNKCTWNLWRGVSFWEASNRTSFQPDLIEVSGGTLKLKTRIKNPNPIKCNETDLQCVLESGGVDSNQIGSEVKGRSFKTGKVEIRAKFPSVKNAFSALWTWPVHAGKGFPYAGDQGWFEHKINEHDLIEARNRVTGFLEGFQSVHDWGPPQGKHVARSGGTYALKPNDWHVYKLERTKERVRIWIDDCLTFDQVTGEGGFELGDWPNYLMLWQTGEFWYGDVQGLNGIFSEIDWVRIYE